jgi:hypothetical protein
MTKYSVANLEKHLTEENPVLLNAAQGFEEIDRIARSLGLIGGDYSSASQISWWPVISMLGTFSAGKSTFINHFLGSHVQRTGNQAVDDRFTVLCYSNYPEPQTLPGIALDADPRFPFFEISRELEQAIEGEGQRINAYLQLKTCSSESLRGKIIIDSPGFDADPQRDAILRITKHIIDISDLALVFFDARHPEPGAMRDTLRYLVADTIKRSDSDKFLYILNQMDTTAREDNPEEVVAAWQRALAEHGLTAGRFYTIYSPEVSVPIEDEAVSKRYKHKRDRDLREIHNRMQQVEIERAYRILRTLERLGEELEYAVIPELNRTVATYRKRVINADVVTFILAAGALGYAFFLFMPPEPNTALALGVGLLIGLLVAWTRVHVFFNGLFAKLSGRWLRKRQKALNLKWDITRAFQNNSRPWPLFRKIRLAGWNKDMATQIEAVRETCKDSIQKLNDLYTNPSGHASESAVVKPLSAIDRTLTG